MSKFDTRPCEHCDSKKDKCDWDGKKDKWIWDGRKDKCDCDTVTDVVGCICKLDKELKCIQDTLGHVDTPSKQKIITCIILGEIERVECKIDKLLRVWDAIEKIECKLDKLIKCLDCCDDD